MWKKITRQVVIWVPVILWAAIIFKLSSGSVPVVSSIYIQDFLFKKGAHMFFFGMFGLLFYRALRMSGIEIKRAIVWSFVAVILYGASDEFHQSFSQSREARIRDIGFDGLGGILVLSTTYFTLPKLPKKFQSFLLKLGIN